MAIVLALAGVAGAGPIAGRGDGGARPSDTSSWIAAATGNDFSSANEHLRVNYSTRTGVIAIAPLEPREGWRVTYRADRLGREGQLLPVTAVEGADTTGARLELHRAGPLVEWYVNGRDQVEQGFVLSRAPVGKGSAALIIEGSVEGLNPLARAGASEILFVDASGRPRLSVRDLHVRDAEAAVVPAHMRVEGGNIQYVIDDASAEYPLVIDPVFSLPAWTFDGSAAGDYTGQSVAPVGDVNGDGYMDLLVGAPGYDEGQTDEGLAAVFLGGPNGLATTPAWRFTGGQDGAQLGTGVAPAGDVNGDGYPDLLVSAAHWDGGEPDEGRAWLFLGGAAGPAATAAWTFETDQASAGISVAPAGDVNGDGYDDVLVGSPVYDAPEVDEGRVWLFLGAASGLATTWAWTAEANQVSAQLGTQEALSTAGDVNADGFADVIIGARYYDDGQGDEGAAFCWYGSAAGLSVAPDVTLQLDMSGAFFGHSTAAAGDVNGDGYADVLVGARRYSNGQGREGGAFLYLGGAAGLATTAAWRAEGEQDTALLGYSVASAGDINDDGFADVIVGAPDFDVTQADEGQACVYLGSRAGLAASPTWTFASGQATALAGFVVSTAGDVNGDGFSDIAVGVPNHDGAPGLDAGRVLVFLGGGDPPTVQPSWTSAGEQASMDYGISEAGAGDVNGDGYSDIVVGARHWSVGEIEEGRVVLFTGSPTGPGATPAWAFESNQPGAHLGEWVSGAGDVNGDGYSDVLVGAPDWNGGEIDEGLALLFLGSPTGLSATPAWSLEGNQAGARLGLHVASAGDVNGDGFSDIAVAAPGHDVTGANDGRVYVFHGSPSGPSMTPAWTGTGGVPGEEYGWAVASAGDTNGDGYSDLVVGAWLFNSGAESGEGRALVYRGSSTGLAATPDWITEGNLTQALYGFSVASAGDVNADGYSDVIVGARKWGANNTGRVFVYHGSASGLQVTAALDVIGGANHFFGQSVAGGGDVNGDGFSDVVVGGFAYGNGQAEEGEAQVFLGSPAGLLGTPALVYEPDQAGAHAGFSVAAAGDVDGDGFADLLVGAPTSDGSFVDEGSVMLFGGNAGNGLPRSPTQWRSDGSRPIDILGTALAPDGFMIRNLARSPFGRDRVRLVWAAQPLAQPPTLGPVTTEPWLDTGLPGPEGSSRAVATAIPSPVPAGPATWRVRLQSRSPVPWQGHWMGLPWNALTETDLRLQGPSGLIAIDKQMSPPGGAPGTTVTTTITVTNLGTTDQTNVLVEDLVRNCFIQADAASIRGSVPGTGSLDGNFVHYAMPRLAAGGSAVVTFTMVATSYPPCACCNDASVASDQASRVTSAEVCFDMSATSELNCSDGRDEDCDGASDCADSDCTNSWPCAGSGVDCLPFIHACDISGPFGGESRLFAISPRTGEAFPTVPVTEGGVPVQNLSPLMKGLDGTLLGATHGSMYRPGQQSVQAVLYVLDPDTGNATRRGAFGPVGGTLEAFTRRADNVLVAASNLSLAPNAQCLIYSLDEVSLATSPITMVGTTLEAIAFLPDGRLVAASDESGGLISSHLVEINTTNGQRTVVGPFGAACLDIESMFWDYDAGRLLAIGYQPQGHLCEVNLSTGEASPIGSLNRTWILATGMTPEIAPMVVEPSALDYRPLVEPLRVAWLDPVTHSRLWLTWQDVDMPLNDVHQGTLASVHGGVYDHGAVACGLTRPQHELAAPVVDSYFLVGARNCGLRSALGRASSGVPRPTPVPPCP